jgi:hypothetical protein
VPLPGHSALPVLLTGREEDAVTGTDDGDWPAAPLREPDPLGINPLELQQHLRLQEARRLMLGEALDAASTGYRVGYNDASHFSREYKRLFGAPPLRDVERLRGASMESAGF